MNSIKSRLPPLPSIGDLIRMIVKVAGDITKSTVIEVGAGPGSLTRSLLSLGAHQVIAVEKDTRFLPALEALQQAAPKGKLHIVHGDMLTLDEAQLVRQFSETVPKDVKLVGNLPFNVGTQLILKWLRQIIHKEGVFAFAPAPMVLLLQKEVAQRMSAEAGSSNFSRLSVMVQRVCQAKTAFDIPGKVFVPPPNVDTSVIRLDPLPQSIGSPDLTMEELEYICKQLFNQRRKTLSNCSKLLGEKGKLLFEGQPFIDPGLRPQHLTVEQWCILAQRWKVIQSTQ